MNLAKALAPSEREDDIKQYSNAIEILERLTAADRTNAQYRISLADTLSSTARLYVGIAGLDREPATTRLQYWTKARALYQRSQELWLQLGRASKIPPTRDRTLHEVSGELARCNDSVAKLQELH